MCLTEWQLGRHVAALFLEEENALEKTKTNKKHTHGWTCVYQREEETLLSVHSIGFFLSNRTFAEDGD